MKFNKYLSGIGMAIPVLCIVCGLILLISPGSTARTICLSIGILILVGGIVDLLRLLPQDNGRDVPGGLVNAIVKTVCGLLLLVAPRTVLELISVAIGLLLMAASIYGIRRALDRRALGSSMWQALLGVSAVGVLISLALVLSRINAANLILRIAGVALIAWGISQLKPLLKKK